MIFQGSLKIFIYCILEPEPLNSLRIYDSCWADLTESGKNSGKQVKLSPRLHYLPASWGSEDKGEESRDVYSPDPFLPSHDLCPF